MVCPKFNSHVHKLKRLVIREYICFYFAIGVQRGASIEECSMFPKKMLMGQWIWLFQKRRYENTYELINTNHSSLDPIFFCLKVARGEGFCFFLFEGRGEKDSPSPPRPNLLVPNMFLSSSQAIPKFLKCSQIRSSKYSW
jgi:hypothetical protein